MKITFLNLTLRHFLLGTLLATLGACSFRKEPLKPTPEVVIVSDKAEIKDAFNDLDEEFLKSPEEEIIQKYRFWGPRELEKTLTKSGDSFIDLAITHKKYNFLRSILDRDFNPFLYSDQASAKIENSDEIKNIIYSYQRPFLNRLIDLVSREDDKDSFERTIKNLGVRASGCKVLIEAILDGYFFARTVAEDSEVVRFVPEEKVFPSIKNIFQYKSCDGVKNHISSADIKKWFTEEWLIQGKSGFKSTEFLKFIASLGSIEKLYIEGYQNGKKIKIDPRLLIFLGKERSKAKTLELLELVEKHISTSLYYYNLYYLKPGEIPYDPMASSACNQDLDSFCEKEHYEILKETGEILQIDTEHLKAPELKTESSEPIQEESE